VDEEFQHAFEEAHWSRIHVWNSRKWPTLLHGYFWQTSNGGV